jgi:tyrosyl-tRNA synthetase
VTERVHGAAALKAAEEVSQLLFGKGDPRALSREALELLEKEIPTFELNGGKSFDTQDVINAVSGEDDSLFKSRSEARRALKQGGVYLNGERLGAEGGSIAREQLLHGRYLLVRKGARSYALIRVRS